ncbi:MAG TPA: PAS domain S-box protein, partial [Luteibaculaceae bacterium]|nr:PAS domain S-box protein [Luteibaculaceae bacterium]
MAPNDFHYLVTTHPSLLEFMQADKGSGIICFNQGDDDRVWISPSARRILSIPYDAYPDKAGLSERVHHRDAEAWEQVMDVNQVNIFDQQGAVIHIKQVAGKYRAFSIKRKVLRDNHQEPYCLLIVIHDLAEVIIEPEPTREHSHQDIGFWEMNENYQVVRCTPEWLDMVGISFDREGVFCWRNVMSSPSDVMAWEQMLHGIRHSGGQGNLTFPIKNPEGLVHWVEIHVSSVDTSKPFKGFEGTVRLVGAPPKSSADDSLSDRMILATSLAQVGIWEINFETKVHHWDATMFQLFDADESKVKPGYVFWNSCLHPDDRERIEWEFNMAKITDQPIEVDFRINSPKGRLKFLRAKAKIFKGENGKLVKMVGTCWDVSNAKIYETHLIKKYRLISGFIEEAPMAIAMFDADLCIVSASDMWRKLFGMPNWQLPGQKLSQLDETLSELLATAFEASTKGIESHGDRTLYTDKFGNQKWLKWRCKPWYVEQSTPGGHSVFIEDVSDQVLLKRDLHISNQAFRNNFDNAAMGMALVGPEGQWIQVNQRLCNIVGYTQDELRHLTFQDITHPEDLASDLALLKKLVQGKIQNYQLYKR